MLLTGHKSRAIFDRYNIIDEQELLTAGDQLARYLDQQAPAHTRRSHARVAAGIPGRLETSLRLVRTAPATEIGPGAGTRAR